jgi:hypothetical protein
MTKRTSSGGNNPGCESLDPRLIRFLDRQAAMLSEAIRIDEYLLDIDPDVSDEYRRLADRAEVVSYTARNELEEQLGAYTTQTELPRHAGVALLAAALAQSHAGTPTEDEVLTRATSNLLERFVAHCTVVAIRDRVEDLLNLAHRRAAIAEMPAPRKNPAAHENIAPSDDRPNGSMTTPEPDMFGFSHL